MLESIGTIIIVLFMIICGLIMALLFLLFFVSVYRDTNEEKGRKWALLALLWAIIIIILGFAGMLDKPIVRF